MANEKEESRMFEVDSARDTSGISQEEVTIELEHVEHEKLEEGQIDELLKSDNTEYSADDIQVLKGLEAVRQRPGMYIGSTTDKGLHHMVREIVDNAIDEAMAGFADTIEVSLLPNDTVCISDNGRGIPVGIQKDTGLPAVETAFTVLHAGGKFSSGSGYKVSGGLHGVGASVVNALSEFCEVLVYREGKIHKIRFENGGQTVAPGLEVIGECEESKTGTTVTFKPDRMIFDEASKFSYSDLKEYLRDSAFLNKNVKISIYDKRDEENLREEHFHYPGGLKEFVKYINTSTNRDPVFEDVICMDGVASDLKKDGTEQKIYVSIAMQPIHNDKYDLKTFCNNIYNPNGGTHAEGFQLALNKKLNTYFRKKGLLKEKDSNFKTEDMTQGLTVVISIKHEDPQYEGQTKEKLTNKEVRSIVSSIFGDRLEEYLMENPANGKLFFDRIKKAEKGRLAAERARLSTQTKSGLSSSMPDKLADCISKNPEERELFIVEGNSAGGSAKDGRDSNTQAILPLRGKILNVEKANDKQIYANAEIDSLIKAIGGGFRSNFDITKVRYHKVIIMTDADVDGSHIRILLLTFFYRNMRPLIENGYVYVACPPLYQLKYNNHAYYCFNDKELEELKAKLPEKAKFKLQRYKGLGEMDAHQLAETTMEKDHRLLLQVSIDDAEDAERAVTNLMGEVVEPRKEYISDNAEFVKNLDI